MKTNVTGLMNLISKYESKLYTLENYLLQNTYTKTIEELNGNINVMEDTKEDFTKYYNEYEETINKIIKYKSILYKKNSTLKLSDGRTIQEAIVENTNLRRMKSSLERLLTNKNTKNRVTEVNNSYFECKVLNFDKEKLETKIEELDKTIENTDFEISKLNGEEFEI